MKLKGALAAAVVAFVALAVLAASGGPSALAKGPKNITWDAKIGNGTSIPAVGQPVSNEIQLGINATGSAPTNEAFFDGTRTIIQNIASQPGPGMTGSLMNGTDIGAKSGTISFTIQTNVIPSLAGSGNIPTTGNFSGLVPRCGDNIGAVETRDWNGDGLPNDAMLSISSNLSMFVANMQQEQAGLRPDALFATHALSTDSGPWNGAQYDQNNTAATNGNGKFIQTYDDDNHNGIPDSEEGGPANEPAGPFVNPSDPYTTGGGGTTYLKGAPETQEDYDHDGIPNGVEYMPDFVPLVVDALGLNPFWTSRSYGAANALPGLAAPTDVNFLAFSNVPGSGGVTFTLLANPLSPANPATQGTATCTPFSTDVITDAQDSAPNYGKGVIAGVGTTPQDLARITNSGAGSVDAVISDANDYDQDGLVAGVEYCAMDATTNTDTDGGGGAIEQGDLLAGKCDPDPTTKDITGSGSGADIDGDGFVNDADNCPIQANPTQADQDGDGVGDVGLCDTFVTTDPLTGLPSGRGSGLATVGNGSIGASTFENTSLLIDNDVVCSDGYTTAENIGDPATTAGAGCPVVADDNDNGTSDVSATNEDEDGDGISDATEVANGTNPMDPMDPFVPNGDYDHDGCTNQQELGNVTSGGGNKNPLNWWDNFDANGDGGVDLSDTVVVLGAFNTQTQALDRDLPDPNNPAFLIEGNDGVDLTDAVNNLKQFNINCGGVPGGAPPTGGYIGS